MPVTPNPGNGTVPTHIQPCGDCKRLDHLPLIADVLKKLRVAEIIDARVPPHTDRVVSVGTCVEAMVLAVLMGTHTLYRVGETLRGWDLELLLGQPVEPEQLSDDKLGRSLDCLFRAGLSGINTAVMLSALERYEVSTKWTHYDTTSLTLHGAYEGSAPGDPEDPDAAPYIARGYSKDYRPDLKQVVFGLSVTGDGNIPLIGRITDGNRSDSLENGFNLRRLAEVLPDPAETVVVADSKLFSGRNLLLAQRYGLSVLTLLPRTVGLWQDAFDEVKEQLPRTPVLRELVRVTESHEGGGEKRDEEVLGSWRGLSVPVTYTWTEAEEDADQPHAFPLRALVVFSTELRKTKIKSRDGLIEKERKALDKLTKRFAKLEFRCEEDARADAERAVAEKTKFHNAAIIVAHETVIAKRSRRGRPKKGEPAPTREFYRAHLSHTSNIAKRSEWLLKESCFILVTSQNVECSDAEVLEAYKNQSGVEQAFRWAKGPARVAPIFLHTASRIAALGLVYIIALMVHALVQRQVRAVLASKDETIPGNRGRTQKPTAEVVYRLMEGTLSLPVLLKDGTVGRWIMGMTTEKAALLRLLDCDLLDRTGILANVTSPGPAQRGYRPPPGARRVGGGPRTTDPKKTRRTWLERRTR